MLSEIKQIEKTVKDFTVDLSSKAPVPGGGGAAAVSGALGAALGSMVASLTIGKEAYKDAEDKLIYLQDSAIDLQKQLLDLVEEDARVFQELMDVYKMPKDTDEDKANRAKAMEEALKAAADVPFSIMKKSCQAIELMDDFAIKGSKMAISDAGCGVILCKSALQSAWLNVMINTKAMKDREFANNLNYEAKELLKDYLPFADQIYVRVETQLA
jgi:formiminotetrahydrofolate cyclodeaminase